MKPQIKVLNYVIGQLKVARRAADPTEALAAIELEMELSERVEKLRAQRGRRGACREPVLSGTGEGRGV